MPRLVIVGDRGSGKTTFLVLLYAAQVGSGSDRADEFRFHLAFDSFDEISNAFQQLMAGSFPDAATKEGIRGIAFHLGYRKPRRGLLPRIRSRGWTSEASASLQVILLRNLEDEMSRLRKGSSLANASLRDVLESDAVVILVDGTKLAVSDEDHQFGPMGAYDRAVETLLSTIQRSGPGRRTWVHPIFVFSKFDSVDPAALRAANVEGAPPEVGEAGPRTAYARALLDLNLPKTMERVRSRDAGAVRFAKPSWFFSGLRTDPPTSNRGARIRHRQVAGAAWEPDFTKEEYLALLERLWRIAADAGD